MKKYRYTFNPDCLPRDRFVYLDTSAIGREPFRKIKKDEKDLRPVDIFRRADKMWKVLSARGMVLSTPGVMDEIYTEVEHYGELKERMAYSLKSKKNRHSSRGFIENVESWQKVCGGIHSMLGANQKIHIPEEYVNRGVYSPIISVSPEDVRDFVSFEEELSIADKELVVSALITGNNGAILSADVALVSAYVSGSREFGINGFVCYFPNPETAPTRGR